ncbi:MAG: hypothetical protein H7178_11410 [Chitinophagaceae bacterium]|nr:hypothetical protein [Chitinophagaceae bacterium]
MKKYINAIRKELNISLASLALLSVSSFSSYSQQMPKMSMDTPVIKQTDMKDMQKDEMLPMPFFTHMGMPLNVGSYNLRAAVLPTQNDGKTNAEYDIQFMTGLSKVVGLHLGAKGTFIDPTLEIMTQFLVWKSKNGMNGFSPLIEFEFPLGKDAKRRVYTLVGFSTTFSNSHMAFNQVLHYSPLEDLAEGSMSVVIRVSNRIFLVTEILGVTEKGASPIFNLLGGIKIKVYKNFLVGIGYQHPITTNKDFSSQYILQPDLFWKR